MNNDIIYLACLVNRRGKYGCITNMKDNIDVIDIYVSFPYNDVTDTYEVSIETLLERNREFLGNWSIESTTSGMEKLF